MDSSYLNSQGLQNQDFYQEVFVPVVASIKQRMKKRAHLSTKIYQSHLKDRVIYVSSIKRLVLVASFVPRFLVL